MMVDTEKLQHFTEQSTSTRRETQSPKTKNLEGQSTGGTKQVKVLREEHVLLDRIFMSECGSGVAAGLI